jgi:hypothetical protein
VGLALELLGLRLDDDVEGQRIWRHVSAAAESWDAMGRPASELYRGVRLDQAVEWRDRTTPDLNALERTFLDASQTDGTASDSARRTRSRARPAPTAGSAPNWWPSASPSSSPW